MSAKDNMTKGQNIVIDSPEYVKKSKKTYIRKIILGFLIGVLLGFSFTSLAIYFKEHSINPLDMLADFFPSIQRFVMPWIILILMIICFLIGEIWIKKSAQLIVSWDGEDDEHINSASTYINRVTMLNNIHTIVMHILYGLTCYNLINTFKQSNNILLTVVLYVISMLINVSQQNRCIKLIKKYAPEKQGSIYDKKFHDVWYASCDEAERQMVGEASRKTYQFMNKAFTIILTITLCVGMFIPIGILCSLFIGILWLMMTCCYTYTCMKMENGK